MRALTHMIAPSGTPRSVHPIAEALAVQPRSFDHNVGEQPKPAAPKTPPHNVGGCTCGGGPRQFIPPPSTYPASFADDRGNLNMSFPAPQYAPYVDSQQDERCMTPVSSGAPQTVAAGASATITIGPTRGMLDGYYLKIVALNPATGLEVDPASYRITPPRVADCPQPCDSTAMRGAFYRGGGDCCLGCPWRAIIGRNADGEAMTFTFTNDGVASVSVQAVVRGYCYARNLCIAC